MEIPSSLILYPIPCPSAATGPNPNNLIAGFPQLLVDKIDVLSKLHPESVNIAGSARWCGRRESIRRLQRRSRGRRRVRLRVTGGRGRGRLRVRLETISIGGLLADNFALQEAVERVEVAILAEPLAALLCEHDVSLAGFLQSIDLLGGGCIGKIYLH